MASEAHLHLQPGTVVNGRYEVVRCLGTGSMGMVYACKHRELAGHLVAMKVLFSEVARDDVAAARFRNEIVASYEVSHPNVVRAYEYFRDGDLIAFTMEYISGGDLADRINEREQLSIEEVVHMLCQMASGVQAIHDAGIVHRDLKPENILLTTQGNVKITDFGIARTGTGPKLTEHGGVVGTIDYVSPEYLERGQVDSRSDIYAMGVMAYEMITGEAPYKGKSVIETITLRLRADPDPPHKLRADCPIALSTIVLKAMRRDAQKRYQSAREMLKDLTALKDSGVIPAASAAGRSTKKLERTLDEFASSSTMPVLPTDDIGAGQISAGGMVSIGQNLGREGYRRTTASGFPSASDGVRVPESPIEDLDDFELEEDDLQFRRSRPGSSGSSFERVVPQVSGGSPNIGISSSGISSQRVRELSEEVDDSNGPNLWLTFLILGAMFCAGFGLGLYILRLFWPELFR